MSSRAGRRHTGRFEHVGDAAVAAALRDIHASTLRPSSRSLGTKPTHPHPCRTRACFRGKPSASTTPSLLPVSLIRPRKRETKTRRIEQRSAGKPLDPGDASREASQLD